MFETFFDGLNTLFGGKPLIAGNRTPKAEEPRRALMLVRWPDRTFDVFELPPERDDPDTQ